MPGKGDIRRRLVHETERYLFTASFLAVFFLAITLYRRLVLAEYHLGSLAFGWAVVKALVLAKVILIGEALHLGQRFQDRPLLFTTLWKTVVFGVLVAAFVAVEHVLAALVHHRPISDEFQFAGGRGDELLARIVLEAIAFLPFFAFEELGRVIGERRLRELFLRGPARTEAQDDPGDAPPAARGG